MFTTFILKHITDFKRDSWNGVLIKIKNRFNIPIILHNIKLINKNSLKSVLIINGAQGAVSEIHRVYHLTYKLKKLNIPHLVITTNLLNKLHLKNLYDFNLLYIHRSIPLIKVVELIKIFHNSDKVIIYDIDDLIFEKNEIQKISFLKYSEPRFRKEFIQKTKNYLNIMKMADLIITPTDFLSKYIKDKYHINTEVLRNHLDQKSLDNGKNIFTKNKNKIKKDIIIGYFPGTKTHQKDLEIINETLQGLLQKYPQLKLKIVGDPSLASFFQATKKQIILHKKVPYKKLIKLYRDVDINLAPSEINNDFCESKSELKYFFAGSCGIPTIASATNAFEYAIKNGVNGYLCYKDKDWDKYLEELINNKPKRLSMGKKAFKHVQEKYNPNYQSQELKKILEKINFLKS